MLHYITNCYRSLAKLTTSGTTSASLPAPPSRVHPCPCGSGLRYKYCCGVTSFTLPREVDIKNLEPIYQQAQTRFEQDHLDGAAQCCLEILSNTPGHARSLRLLADIRKREGKVDTFETLLKRLVKLLPNDSEIYCDLSLLLYERGTMGEAKQYARDAIRCNPKNPQAHNLMGMILTNLHDYPSGEYHYHRALELHPPVGKLCANLGLNLKNQGKLEEAREWYRKAMDLESDNIDSLLGWVRMEEAGRELPRADELLRQAELMQPDNPGVMNTRSILHRRTGKSEEALRVLETLEQKDQRISSSSSYHFDCGDVLDKLGRYDDAFAAFTKANEAVRNNPERQYQKQHADNLVGRLKHFFTRERIENLPHAKPLPSGQPAPIFIVGFPRSGTTMVEQILTSHPDISAGDELKYIGELARVLPQMLNSDLAYPECLIDLWLGENRGALDTLRDYYLKKVELQGGVIEPGVSFFTDKMPLNETHLGLIGLVFPKSPIIHLLRHPLDVVCSSFFNDFTHGFNCSYDLNTVADHYVLIRDLVDHYLDNMELNYLAIKYEDIVTNEETNVRRLLELVGVPWDNCCLQFHENRRYARTASYAQVTEKLYTSSINRYKNYRRHVEPVFPLLEPAIKKLGYTVE